MKNKKLLFITTRLFWPADSGRKVSLYNYCRGLHDLYGYDIYLYSFLEARQEYNEIEKPVFIKEVRIASSISVLERALNILTRSIMSKHFWPLQCSLFYSKENENVIRDYIRLIIPDVIMTDMIRTATYYNAFSGINCMKILDMDDVLSIRYERQIISKYIGGNIAGKYSSHLPCTLNKIISFRSVQNAILSMEAKRLKHAEVDLMQYYDKAILVSENETRQLNERIGEKKAHTVTIGVNYEYMAEEISVIKEPRSLSFMGDMEYSANIDSLDIIANQVLPLIRSPRRLYVIGNCPDTVKKRYQNCEDVFFLGKVDDIRKAIQQTEVFVAPIAYGSGIKTKILEVMAMGMPVVTNSLGVESIGVINGKQCYYSDDNRQLAAYIELLYSDPGLIKEMASEAQMFIREVFRWEAIFDEFGKIGL